jgi:hypothetical protein
MHESGPCRLYLEGKPKIFSKNRRKTADTGAKAVIVLKNKQAAERVSGLFCLP